MKRQLYPTIIGLLQEVKQKTLVLTCMDFLVEIAKVNNKRVSVITILGVDLESCCADTLQDIANQIESQGIKQVIILEHHACQVHKHLLTDFDKQARWFALAEKLREKRLLLHGDGVSLMDSKKFALSHARNQFNFLENYIQNYCRSKSIEIPRLRSMVADTFLSYRELIKIEITSFKN